jgi:hypothetical protein
MVDRISTSYGTQPHMQNYCRHYHEIYSDYPKCLWPMGAGEEVGDGYITKWLATS